MARRSVLIPSLTLTLLIATACSDSSAPSSNDTVPAGFQRLVAIVGLGTGEIRATRIPHPTTAGNFAVHIEVKVHGAQASTTYAVQRAPEAFIAGTPAGFDVSTLTDGSCQRGLAMAPWSVLVPATAAFLTFPDQGTGAPTVTTNQLGDGQADFTFSLALSLPAFDVMFRLVENGAAPKAVLQSGCVTLLQ